MPDLLSDFNREPFSAGGRTYDVLWQGEGPAVVVIAEIPGITPAVAGAARRFVSEGFSVALPHLFGDLGAEPSIRQMLKVAPRLCVAREFAAFSTGTTAPIADWLRALARYAHDRCGGPGVGVVGMCFTGGFALALATDPAVLVPVMSQPSLPLGPRASAKAGAGVSDTDLAAVRARTEYEGLCVLGLRFTTDPLVPPARFATLREALGDAFVAVEIDSSPGNPHGFDKKSHSVLTEAFVDQPDHPTRQAYDLVVLHLRRRLLGASDG
jgi:dienelactone hydrolase